MEYANSVKFFSNWCKSNFLQLNISKTKELTIDFRQVLRPNVPICIDGEPVEQVVFFKYLGVILDNKLSFSQHTTAIQKKCQQRLHVLRRLRSFNVCPHLLLLLYRSIVEPLMTYCNVCYFSLLSVVNRNKLLKISHTASKIIGRPTPVLSELADNTIVRKARAITADVNHPLYSCFEMLPSGRRYRCLKCSKLRFSKSFVPTAIRKLNL